jgi:hypothetical protein
MKKNIIVIPWIDRDTNVINSVSHTSPRSSGYEWGVKSWTNWAKQNNADVFILKELLYPESEMLISWQRWHVLDILEHNNIEYDQVLLVDADSTIHPSCPNFFELTDGKLTSVANEGDYEWVARNINLYSQHFLDKKNVMKLHTYHQCGYVILNNTHKEFLTRLINFYWDNKDAIIQSYSQFRVGTDQGLFNLLREEWNIPTKILPREYSLTDVYRKNLIYTHPSQWWEDSLENLSNSAYVVQWNSIPENPLNRYREYWMQRVYNEWWGNV